MSTARSSTDANSRPPFHYLAIEGPIGAGKTTLARRLASHFSADLLLEAPFDNPFLPRFYENPTAWALAAQLSFLLQRARQMSEVHQSDLFTPCRVADFMLEKDRMFATLNLDADELDLYEQVYSRVIGEAPQPDVVVYLQAPTRVLLERIASRGIEFEQGMDPDYLSRLGDAYHRFFGDPREVPFERVVVVNTANVNFLDRDDHFSSFVTFLYEDRKGIDVFDPDAFL